MSRISQTEIKRVSSEADLVALVQSRGISLQQAGKNWIGICPFHQNGDGESLVVSPNENHFKCEAKDCNKEGNVIEFVRDFDGVSFRHAFELLDNGGKLAFQQSGGQSKITTVPKLPCPLDTDANEGQLLQQVVKFYHERLKHSPQALKYLSSRGLNDEEMLKKFQIGFSDRTLGLRLPKKNRVAGATLRTKLRGLGIYRDSGHEHFNGAIVIPIFNSTGETITQLFGRRIERRTPKDKRHLYLDQPLQGIFNPDALNQREIILTDSIFNALTFYSNGMEAVTCSIGNEGMPEDLFNVIKGVKIESVLIAFRANEEWEARAEQVSSKLQSIGIECRRIRFPWGMDANELFLEEGEDGLRKTVNNAEWLGSGSTEPTEEPLSFLADEIEEEEEENIQPVKPSTPEPVAKGDYHELKFGDRIYRVIGLEKNNSLEVLKITLRVMEEGGLYHIDSIDIYKDGDRRRFIERGSEETLLEKELIKRDLGKLLLGLEGLQEERLSAPITDIETAVELTPEEQEQALEFLRSPDLLSKLTETFSSSGIVGEETNVLAAYLACTSRKLSKPLAIIIQSTSAAGKTALMDAVLSFFPSEEQVRYSSMTGQSLYYLGEDSLKHKILAVAEEEGASKAGYALKLLQSDGRLTIASTGKDATTGRMETQEYHVEGPCSIIFTTTSIDIDEELMNRCLILTVDESQAQTERIHALQRQARTIEGILAVEKKNDALQVMVNAQRLLKPYKIVNDYSLDLTFVAGRTRTRRDHEKYLALIDSITLLHQHQREKTIHTINGKSVEMLHVALDDIEAAGRIAPEVLGRSLDELPPQTRSLLEAIKAFVRHRMKEEEIEQDLSLFSRRDIREATGWSYMQIKRHLNYLSDLEYVGARSGRNGTAFKYELLVNADEAPNNWQVGLLDIEELREKYTYDGNLTRPYQKTW